MRDKMTYAEYATWESTQAIKHEYIDGEVFAMAGGSPEHSRIASNVTAILTFQMHGRDCRPYNSDMRVRTESGKGLYPDGSALCGRPRFEGDPPDLMHPTIVVEVLSPHTEAYDRGEKFAHYRTIPALAEYLLVSSRHRSVELFTRAGDHWELRAYGPGESVPLASIDCTIAVDDVYDKVFESQAG